MFWDPDSSPETSNERRCLTLGLLGKVMSTPHALSATDLDFQVDHKFIAMNLFRAMACVHLGASACFSSLFV